MSMLLGAPARKIRMQFLAVLCSDTPGAVAAWRRRGLTTSANHEATMPVPASLRKLRRVNPGPSARPLALSHDGHSILLLRMVFSLLSRSADLRSAVGRSPVGRPSPELSPDVTSGDCGPE